MAEEQRRKSGGNDGHSGSSRRNGKNQDKTDERQGKGQPHPPFTPEEARKEGRKGGKASHDDR